MENDDDVDLAVGVGWLLFGFGATAAALLLDDVEDESSKAAFKRSSVLFFKFNKSSWTLLGNLREKKKKIRVL